MKIIGVLLATLLVVGGIFYSTTIFAYQPSEELFNFPIPKNAVLIKESEDVKIYNWSNTAKKDDLPFGYEIVLKTNGWQKGDREDDSVYYTKRNHQIDVISQSKQLTLRILK